MHVCKEVPSRGGVDLGREGGRISICIYIPGISKTLIRYPNTSFRYTRYHIDIYRKSRSDTQHGISISTKNDTIPNTTFRYIDIYRKFRYDTQHGISIYIKNDTIPNTRFRCIDIYRKFRYGTQHGISISCPSKVKTNQCLENKNKKWRCIVCMLWRICETVAGCRRQYNG